MPEDPVAMIACYQVRPETTGGFIDLLRATEQVYRDQSAITERPILRLQSRQEPGYIIEVIEWRNLGTISAIQDNEAIQAMWSRIKASWLRGDFPFQEVPEASVPWAILQVIR